MKRLEEIQARAEATKKGIPYVPPTEVININKSNKNQKNMDKLAQFFGLIILAAFMVFFGAVLSGTILWAIYPHIFAFFPNAAKAGVLAPTLGWWDAVCVTWIFGILVKSSTSSSSKKD